MLGKKNYSAEHILEQIKRYPSVDPAKVMNLIATLLCGRELKTDGASIPNKDKRMRAFKSIPDPEAFSLIRQAIQSLTEKGLL